MQQKGFATLEVILMILVIAILASIAVPRFSAVSASANTAKIQADLSTIDTAIALYHMREGKYPSALGDLSGYLNETDKLKPPSGKCYIAGQDAVQTVPTGGYTFKEDATTGEKRAALGNYTAEDFSIEKKTSSSSSGSGNG